MQRRFKEGANCNTRKGFFIALVSMGTQNLNLREEEKTMKKKERIFWVVAIILMVLAGSGNPQVWAAEKVDKVKIGGLLTLTGVMALSGQNFRDAMEFAKDEINAQGGIKAWVGQKLKSFTVIARLSRPSQCPKPSV